MVDSPATNSLSTASLPIHCSMPLSMNPPFDSDYLFTADILYVFSMPVPFN
jgi:hypothetical protein